MMYGPLAKAIEALCWHCTAKPPKKDVTGNQEYNATHARLWDAIARAQDDFYDRILDGSLKRGD